VSELIGFDVDRVGIATITINRPDKRNAINESMMTAISESIDAAERDPVVKVILLRAVGGSFCSGYDLSNPDAFWGPHSADGLPGVMVGMRDRAELMRRVLYSLKPIVAEVGGDCLGIGMYFVLVADMAIVADDAAFGVPEERFGAAGTSWLYGFLLAQCGLKITNEIMLTGRRLAAQELLGWGLVNRVVPRTAVPAAARQACEAVCSLPREGIAAGRAAAHMAFSRLGLGDSFTSHYALLPYVASMTRREDEFDFHRVAAEEGLKVAVAKRDAEYEGEYWKW
jgi:enoyl-CoA hydratase/carnithine racemase